MMQTDNEIFLKLLASEAFCELRKYCNNVAYDRKPIVDLALTLQQHFLQQEIAIQAPYLRIRKLKHICIEEGCEVAVSDSRWNSGQHLCYYCNERKIRTEKDARTPKCRICHRKLKVIFGKQVSKHETCCYCRQDLRSKGRPLRIAG